MQPVNSGKSYQLARYQEKQPDNTVRCQLCPHECLIHEGKVGICNARANFQGDLFSLSYGKPCSASIDPIEKKPLFHFLPGSDIFSLATAGCNFHCLNCQNWQISQSSPQQLNHYDLLPEEIVKHASSQGLESIAFTYTEPTVFYEYAFDIAKIAHEKGLKTVIISNGYINRQPLLDLCPHIDAANIDLKCFDDSIYHKLTGGSLQPVLNTLLTLKEQGVWLEITNLLIPEYSDNPEMIKSMCDWLAENGFADTPLHFSRFFPTYKLTTLKYTSKNILLQAKEIAENSGIKYVYIGNIPELKGENTICPKCKRTLVERTGYVVNENNIKDSKCRFCGEIIAGIWK
jgi:pyruvate formate lyase activating enzyme